MLIGVLITKVVVMWKGEFRRKGFRTSEEDRKDVSSGWPVFQAFQRRLCTDLKVSVLRACEAADLLGSPGPGLVLSWCKEPLNIQVCILELL